MSEKIKAPADQESFKKPLFKVTLMRHEAPYYKDEGHDLKPEGVAGAIATGQRFRESGHFSPTDQVHIVHSPKPRAKGTAGFVAEGAGIAYYKTRSTRQLRASDIPRLDLFMERIMPFGNPEAVARDHHTCSEFYEDSPDIIEPSSKKKERLYRAFEYLIRLINKQPQEDPNTPHIFAVSHFEIITHLIEDVFGSEFFEQTKHDSPSFGEAVTIEAYSTGDKDKLLLHVGYNEHQKEVHFDRTTRSIEIQ